jgi:outer membrane protein OmpA-like peptidoglycan-associated protein
MVDKHALKQSSLVLTGGLFGLLLAVVLLFMLSGRVNRLEQRLIEAERQENQLRVETAEAKDRSADYAAMATEAKDRAFEAEGELSVARRERTRAEWDRELAREVADRAERASAIAEADAARTQAGLDNLRAARRHELDRMRDALAQIVETERTPLGMVMRLGEDALRFGFDDTEVREQDRELLSRIVGVLLASRGYRLYVDGHTDDQGPAVYNQDLSQRRAASVRAYFTAAGIPEELIEARGFGESNPRQSGSSIEAKRANRRVEIGIVDTVIEYQRELDQ